MSTSTVQLKLQLVGQQAAQQMKRMNLDITQAQQQQKQNLNNILNTQNRINSSTQQGSKYGQQQLRTGQSMVQTNRLLTQLLQQQQRSAGSMNQQLRQQQRTSQLISQQLRQQERSYQLQLNSLRSQVREAERLRQQLERAGRAGQNGNGGGFGGGSVAGSVMGGYMVAKGVIGTPLERARSFETKIFDAATSVSGGFAGMSHDEIVSSNKRLSNYARYAVRKGHGTVDGMGDAASILGASGAFSSVEELEKPLMAIAKGAFAAGASEQDIAQLVKQLKISGITPDRVETQLARMVKSGYLGSFELKDMAGLMPETLPFAAQLGYTGEKGVNMVTTHLQLARQYTGLPSEANTNIKDLYTLAHQRHFRMAMFKFMPYTDDDPTMTGADLGMVGKKARARVGFDVTKFMADSVAKGIDPMEAIARQLDKKMSGNPEYARLMKDLTSIDKTLDAAKKSKNAVAEANALADKKKITGQLSIIGGAEIGEIFHNQQSLSGILSIIAAVRSGQLGSIEQQSWEDTAALKRVYDAKSEIEPAKAHALEQETILATINIYDKVKNTLGDFEGSLTQTMRANQALTASAIAAAGALAIVAGVGVGGKLLGGGSGGAGGGGFLPKAAKFLTKFGTPLTLGAGAYGLYDTATNNSLTQSQRNVQQASIVGGTGGALTGAAAGAFVGSIVPVLGTAIGGLIGGALGYWGGSEGGEAFGEYFNEQNGIMDNQNQILEKQVQQSDALLNEFRAANQKLDNIANRPVMINGGSLFDAVSQKTNTESNRHGSIPSSPLPGLGG